MDKLKKILYDIRLRVTNSNTIWNTKDFFIQHEEVSNIVSEETGFDISDGDKFTELVDKLCVEFGIVYREFEIDEDDEEFTNIVETILAYDSIDSNNSQEGLKQYMENKFGITESDENFESVFDELIESWNNKIAFKAKELSLDSRQGLTEEEIVDIEDYLESLSKEITIEDIKQAIEEYTEVSEFDDNPGEFNQLLYSLAEKYEIQDQIEL